MGRRKKESNIFFASGTIETPISQEDMALQLLSQMTQTLAGIDKRLKKLESTEVDEDDTPKRGRRKAQPIAIPDRKLGKNSHLDNFGKPKQGDPVTNFDLFMKKVSNTAEARRAEKDKKIDKKLNKGLVPTERRPPMAKIKIKCENCKQTFEIEENLIPMDGYICTSCCRKG